MIVMQLANDTLYPCHSDPESFRDEESVYYGSIRNEYVQIPRVARNDNLY